MVRRSSPPALPIATAGTAIATAAAAVGRFPVRRRARRTISRGSGPVTWAVTSRRSRSKALPTA
ncbi:hypothetical protein [Actinomadura nitritigenes]|uniref:hypothetical protein n=1 Tax=Actinomadura nitritigenes TaxID=134602 RepID=UPI003D909BE1